jgi:hypothetical protein
MFLPKGTKIHDVKFTDGISIVEYTGPHPILDISPAYTNTPLWKALNGNNEKETTNLSQRRRSKFEGHNTKTKESSAQTPKGKA